MPSFPISHAVVLVGHMHSGKSTLGRRLAKHYRWDLVGFGSLVRRFASERQIQSTREELQDLGSELLIKLGPRGIWHAAIDEKVTTSILLDGVRHLSVLSEVRSDIPSSRVVALRVSIEERYRRYTAMTANPVSYEAYCGWNAHPIELGIDDLFEAANVVIDGTQTNDVITRTVDDLIRAWLPDVRPATDQL